MLLFWRATAKGLARAEGFFRPHTNTRGRVQREIRREAIKTPHHKEYPLTLAYAKVTAMAAPKGPRRRRCLSIVLGAFVALCLCGSISHRSLRP